MLPEQKSHFEIVLDLTPAQIQTAFSVPIEIVPAPGANKAIEVMNGSSILGFGTTAFTSSDLLLKTAGAVDHQAEIPGFLLSVASNWRRFGDASGELIANAALNITANADSLVGDSDVRVYVAYRIIQL